MDKQKLHERLEELHRELQQVDSLDSGDREMLLALAGEVQKVLGAADDRAQHYEGLGDRLKESVAQVEASHPRATMLMREVIDQLAYMGI